MSRTPEVKKKSLDKETVSRIMRTVPRHEEFHFYKEQGFHWKDYWKSRRFR